eukprot:5952916-Prorocentrum_lima.AAC.1
MPIPARPRVALQHRLHLIPWRRVRHQVLHGLQRRMREERLHPCTQGFTNTKMYTSNSTSRRSHQGHHRTALAS